MLCISLNKSNSNLLVIIFIAGTSVNNNCLSFPISNVNLMEDNPLLSNEIKYGKDLTEITWCSVWDREIIQLKKHLTKGKSWETDCKSNVVKSFKKIVEALTKYSSNSTRISQPWKSHLRIYIILEPYSIYSTSYNALNSLLLIWIFQLLSM